MGREENVKVFEDTRNLCRSNVRLKESIKRSISRQEIIYEENPFDAGSEHRYQEQAEVIVSRKRSFEAASAYAGLRVCVHNFASSTTPGGGVVRGASAQEECLCRISTLYPCINVQGMWDKFYNPHREKLDNIHNGDCIYTPGVIVLKTDDDAPKRMEESRWYEVDVITLAAPKIRGSARHGEKPKMVTDKELLAIHEKRMRRFVDIAKAKGDDVLILGAFGCGAYSNDPEIAAQGVKNILGDYLYDFRTIEFAVYCRPGDDLNYRIFKRVLNG